MISLDLWSRLYKLFETKNNNRKTLAKHVTPQNKFVIAKFTVLKGLIGKKLGITSVW